jgi:hypothetical protein
MRSSWLLKQIVNIAACTECVSDLWTGFIWKIVFDTLYIQTVTTISYRAISISTLHSSLLHMLAFSVFTSRILATDS